MFTHPYDPHRSVGTLTTSRRIDAAPHDLARLLLDPSLSRSTADARRPHPVAIHLDFAPRGRGAITICCRHSGISERQPLRMRYRSPLNLTAHTEDDASIPDTIRAPTFAFTIDLTPLVQPGPVIATRVSLFFHFVREGWWPRDMMDALAVLADGFLQRLAEPTHGDRGVGSGRGDPGPSSTGDTVMPEQRVGTSAPLA